MTACMARAVAARTTIPPDSPAARAAVVASRMEPCGAVGKVVRKLELWRPSVSVTVTRRPAAASVAEGLRFQQHRKS